MSTILEIQNHDVNRYKFIFSKDIVDLLVLSAHPDDGEYGLGGLLLKHGRKTAMVEFTKGEKASYGSPEKRLNELKQSTDILNLSSRLLFSFPDGELMNNLELMSKTIISLIDLFQPKIIFVPFRNDIHPDHRAVSYATILACLEIKSTHSGDIIILEYLINGYFTPNFLINTTDTRSLKSHLLKLFLSQKRLQNECTKISLIREAEFGKQINCNFAEGFRLLNYVTKKQQLREILFGVEIFEAINISTTK